MDKAHAFRRTIRAPQVVDLRRATAQEKQRIQYKIVEAATLYGPGSDNALNFHAFPGGAMLMTSCLDVAQPTEFRFAHDPAGTHISAQYFLSGEATIVFGDDTTADWTHNGMSIIRADTPGFRLRVAPGQTLRHVCVAMYDTALINHLSDVRSPQITDLISPARTFDHAIPIPSDPEARRVAETLYDHVMSTGVAGFKAEALTMWFLSEVLERYSDIDPGTNATLGIMPWQRDAARQIAAALDADPGALPSSEELLRGFRMGDAMARRVFRAEFGTTPAAYARRIRMAQARRTLIENGASIKEIAFDSGYSHVGNFTRAYVREFGENPSATREKARNG